jgi:sugar/nucleoside kinase (ribokinase family)
MTAPRYDVLGIGNAIVDVIARAEDDFLVAQGMHKGTMALIDEARAEKIYQAMGPAVESSGGSAANTIVGVASFGGRAAFVGKIKDDELGRAFAHDIRSARVAFDVKPAGDGPSTARCYIMVTPDGERTMNTFLGAAQDLQPADIDEAKVASAALVYLEGYLWDPPQAKEAFVKAAAVAHKSGRRVALTLSDSFCVDRYRAEFLALIRKGTVDIVFANEHELHSLYETADFDTAVKALRGDAKLAVVTRSEKGCVVVTRKEVEAVQAMPIEQVVDVTGAGDLFAAGFLVGLARGKDNRTAARLGALAAAEVIQHIGARPAVSLKALAAENGLPV